jgi:hypothetical protein
MLSFLLACLFPFLIAQSPLLQYSPQFIACLSIVVIFLSLRKKYLPPFIIVAIINLIVFSTGGLRSPLLFLDYFLLFSLSFQENHRLMAFYCLILVLFLSQTLDSFSSLISLVSFAFISPLALFVTQNLEKDNNQKEEVLLWLTLELKQELLSLVDNPNPQTKTIKKIIAKSDHLINELSNHD